MSKKAKWIFDSIQESALYILAHEIFHYLAYTNQLYDRNAKLIKNLEANANWYAHGIVVRFHDPLEVKM